MAPHRVTARLGYAYKRFNGTLGMVYRDASPDSTTYGNFKAALTQFDTSLNYRINRWLSVYVQGRNITGKPVKWYWTPPGVAEGTPIGVCQNRIGRLPRMPRVVLHRASS